MHSFQLEKYNGNRGRHACPSCGRPKQFARYIVKETGAPVDDAVGICNRKSKCGYHYTPGEYFRDNPDSPAKPPRAKKSAPLVRREREAVQSSRFKVQSSPPVSFHTRDVLNESLGQNGRNPFFEFLINLFPDDFATVKKVAADYFLGYFHNLTCFWQIDIKGRIRKGKLMRYDARSGKRRPVFSFIDKETREPVEIGTFWVHKVLQKQNRLPLTANFQNCFFGEHLLADAARSRQTVAVVEAEKTALICAVTRPNFVWLSVGAQSHLTMDRMQVLKNRNVILYPDADAYALWKEKETEAAFCVSGINIKTSDFLEKNTTGAEKSEGFDLADYIVREQTFINNFNARIERIKTDRALFEKFEFLLDERIAICGSEDLAYTPESVRALIDYVV